MVKTYEEPARVHHSQQRQTRTVVGEGIMKVGMSIAAAVMALAVSVSKSHAATIAVTSTNDSGPGTLRYALANAADGDTIDASSISGTILLTSNTELLVTNSVNIIGPGPALLAVSRRRYPYGRIFHVGSNAVVKISSVTITNGLGPSPNVVMSVSTSNDYQTQDLSGVALIDSSDAVDAAGGIYNQRATLTVSNCVLTGNYAGYGSGIYNDHGKLVISACTLRGNFAGGGGGVYNDGTSSGTATVEIVNSTLTVNTADYGEGEGGGVENVASSGGFASLQIVNSIVSNNKAISSGYGGGVENAASGGTATVQITNSILSSNSASHFGGGIDNYAQNGGLAIVEVANTSLSGNKGGGIANRGEYGGFATMDIKGCTLNGNYGGNGGGIYNQGATLRIANSTISSNSTVYGAGGGACNQCYGDPASLEIRDCTLTGNSASSGNGIYNVSGAEGGTATVLVVNSTLSGNSATNTKFGSDIYNYADCSWYDDSCLGHGGFASLQIANSTLSGSSATNGIPNTSIYNETHGSGTAVVTIASTILDAGTPGLTVTNDSGTITSLGHNLSSDDGGGFLTATGDQTNTDPMLGPLQDNGGPTFTCALLPGSPAINAGDPNFTPPPEFDQRGPGFPRVAYGRIDIGAFEVQTLPDSDGDGVPDMFDQCPNTPPGAIVNTNGCSIAQLVPCDGPVTGGTWKNHGQYVAAVVHEATVFLQSGLITRRQWAHIVTQAARSRCGWNRHWDRDGDRDWHRPWDCDRDADWGRERH
jgi:hypothetical protein